MYTPFAHAFAYAIKQTPYAFVAKIILCMYLLYVQELNVSRDWNPSTCVKLTTKCCPMSIVKVLNETHAHSQKRAGCNKSVDILQQLVAQADITMHPHGLRQLVHNKSVASCQQTCCKLFQQVVRSLQTTSCNKLDFNTFVATWWNSQACCNLLTNCNKSVKLTTCNKSVAFLAVCTI